VVAVLGRLSYRHLRQRRHSIKDLVYALFDPNKGPVRVLVVTAHPDDECLFFGPTVRALLEEGPHAPVALHLLCLSRGQPSNHPSDDGHGNRNDSRVGELDNNNNNDTRIRELQQSCRHLGIQTCQCPHYSDQGNEKAEPFVDGFDQEWEPARIMEAIRAYVQEHHIDVIITFDDHGVSGHPNHRAVHQGLLRFLERGDQPECLRAALTLHSCRLWRKYLGVLTYPMDWLLLNHNHQDEQWAWAVPCPLTDYWIMWRAMQQHASQFVWFRRLYLLSSRYLFVNSLRIVYKSLETKKTQ
jgi:N-acetylglucosaminylphosphatidylinositol deacetylase